MAWACLPRPSNLLDLAFKIKTKQKALTNCADGNEKFPYFRTTLSSSVGGN